jgi:AcrR family transcriptional regulator
MAPQELRQKPTRGRINRTAIVAAALEVADRDGLDGLSMRAVARELAVVPMALYRHVASKDDLLDALVEGLLADVELPRPAREWKRGLRALAGALREAGHRHPALVPLLLSRPAISAESHRPVERMLQILEQAGLQPRERVTASHVITTYVLGFVLSETSGRFDSGSVPARDRLAALPEDTFPAHKRAARYLTNLDWSREFDAGVELLIKAVERHE